MLPFKAIQKFLAAVPSQTFWIGYSGGLDSTVLLHILATQSIIPVAAQLRAIHVHHGLNRHADAWVRHCETVCRALSIPLSIECVDAQARSGESPEAAARDARYGAFRRYLGSNDSVVTAHHQDDQAETLLLHLMRASGPRGLAAMAPMRSFGDGFLLRPLLDVSRADLEVYARQHDLTWVEDDSNDDIRFDRNFLRRDVMPLLQQRWPGAVTSLARVAELQRESLGIIDDALAPFMAEALVSGDGSLRVSVLRSMTAAMQAELLRAWIAQKKLPSPPRAKLLQIQNEVLSAQRDAQPLVVWQGAELRRYRDALFVGEPLAPVCAESSITWRGESQFGVPWGGVVEVETLAGGIAQQFAGSCVTLRPRCGGERLKLPGESFHRELKALLHAANMPPWVRDRIPLVYIDGELAAIADRWVEAKFFAGSAASGLHFRWNSNAHSLC